GFTGRLPGLSRSPALSRSAVPSFRPAASPSPSPPPILLPRRRRRRRRPLARSLSLPLLLQLAQQFALLGLPVDASADAASVPAAAQGPAAQGPARASGAQHVPSTTAHGVSPLPVPRRIVSLRASSVSGEPERLVNLINPRHVLEPDPAHRTR